MRASVSDRTVRPSVAVLSQSGFNGRRPAGGATPPPREDRKERQTGICPKKCTFESHKSFWRSVLKTDETEPELFAMSMMSSMNYSLRVVSRAASLVFFFLHPLLALRTSTSDLGGRGRRSGCHGESAALSSMARVC